MIWKAKDPLRTYNEAVSHLLAIFTISGQKRNPWNVTEQLRWDDLQDDGEKNNVFEMIETVP